jgi:hypothetical protein
MTDLLTSPSSRQLALAAGPEVFFRLQLRHAKQVTENLKPVTPGQLDQFDSGLRDESHGLVGAALSAAFFRWRSLFRAGSGALPANRWLAQKIRT